MTIARERPPADGAPLVLGLHTSGVASPIYKALPEHWGYLWRDGGGTLTKAELVDLAQAAEAAPLVVVAFSIGVSVARQIARADIPVAAWLLLDGTHASLPQTPESIERDVGPWMRVADRARADEVLLVVTATLQTYVREILRKAATADSLATFPFVPTIEVASRLFLSGSAMAVRELSPGTYRSGSLHVEVHASAPIDGPAHTRELREHGPRLLRDVVIPRVTAGEAFPWEGRATDPGAGVDDPPDTAYPDPTPPAVRPVMHELTVAQLPARPLRRGDSGPAVRELQGLLQVTVDGIFGPVTERTLRGFQRLQGLVIDGIAGPRTWAALEGNAPAIVAPPTDEPAAPTTDRAGGTVLAASGSPVRTAIGDLELRRVLAGELGARLGDARLRTLWCQLALEHGAGADARSPADGRAAWNCYCWNFGNRRGIEGDAGHYQMTAGEIIDGHEKPITGIWPAYSTAETGMETWIDMLGRRYARAWEASASTDLAAYARALKSGGYYTAAESHYAAGLATWGRFYDRLPPAHVPEGRGGGEGTA